VRVAGDKMDEAILQYVKRKYNLLIGEPTAEHIKVAIGNAFPGFSETAEIKGLDMVSGVPKALTLHSDEVREALSEPVRIIVDAVKSVFEETPPELAEISTTGALYSPAAARCCAISTPCCGKRRGSP